MPIKQSKYMQKQKIEQKIEKKKGKKVKINTTIYYPESLIWNLLQSPGSVSLIFHCISDALFVPNLILVWITSSRPGKEKSPLQLSRKGARFDVNFLVEIKDLWIFFKNLLHVQATFASYAERTAFERPLTSGVAYAVKVLRSEREEFEKQQGWTIKKMDSQEQPPVREDDVVAENQETSPVEEEYAPVIFAQDAYKHVVSLDMLTGKVKI